MLAKKLRKFKFCYEGISSEGNQCAMRNVTILQNFGKIKSGKYDNLIINAIQGFILVWNKDDNGGYTNNYIQEFDIICKK